MGGVLHPVTPAHRWSYKNAEDCGRIPASPEPGVSPASRRQSVVTVAGGGEDAADVSALSTLTDEGRRLAPDRQSAEPRAASLQTSSLGRIKAFQPRRRVTEQDTRIVRATADSRPHNGHSPSGGRGQLASDIVLPDSACMKMPQFLELKDKFGNSLFFGNGGDVRLAATPLITDFRKQLKDVQELYLRHDDVIITGYPKTGNHWHQQIIRMLIQNSTEYTPNTFTTDVLEYIPESFRPPATQPRVFFSHLLFRHLPRQVTEKKVKIVYLMRNPKDTFVSMYAQVSSMSNEMGYAGTWDQFFQVMLEWGFWHGNYFDHLLDWEKEIEAHPDHPVFVSSFEDMKRDPVEQIEKLNDFLDLGRSRQLCARIASVCNIASMREKEEVQVQALRQVYDTAAPVIYRKGEIGDWKNWFTPEQNEQFDEVYRKRMSESKRTLVFE